MADPTDKVNIIRLDSSDMFHPYHEVPHWLPFWRNGISFPWESTKGTNGQTDVFVPVLPTAVAVDADGGEVGSSTVKRETMSINAIQSVKQINGTTFEISTNNGTIRLENIEMDRDKIELLDEKNTTIDLTIGALKNKIEQRHR